MRFLIVGDLHGAKPRIRFKDFDAIIAPGDFCYTEKIRPLYFKLIKERQENSDIDHDWWAPVGKRKARQLIQESLVKGRAVLEYLNSFGVPVYLISGNADWTGSDSDWEFESNNHWKDLKRGLSNINDCENRIADAGECLFIGHGNNYAPEYPQTRTARARYSSSELNLMAREFKKRSSKLEALIEKAEQIGKPIIYLTHNMPYGTKFDMIAWKDSPRHGQHIGSVIARDMIRKYQPKLAIGGHMHEYHGKIMMGRTTVIDAGHGKDVNTFLELKDGRITRLEFKR